MKKLNVGVVGLRRGSTYAKLFSAYPRTQVTAICDIDRNVLERYRSELGLSSSQCFDSYDEFIKKAGVDIVVVATPIPYHAEQTIKAMEAGKHVLCEVTMANNVKDCETVVRTARKTGMKYMMAENYCYFHYIREWEKMVKEGALGRIFYAEAEYVHQIRDLLKDPKTGRTTWRANRPPIHYITHCLGPILMLLEDRVVKATASGKTTYTMPDVGVGAIDMQVALFETAKGVTIKVLRSNVAPREPPTVYYSIYGTKGFVENGRTGNPWQVTRGLLYIEGVDKTAREVDWYVSDPNAPEEARKYGTAEYYLVRDFVNAIETDTPPPIDAAKAADMTVPGLIAHEAAMKGNVWLDVPHFE
jgi:predicted dehydrogenase